MQLHWNAATRSIIIEFSNGEKKECNAVLWSRIEDTLKPNLFQGINRYWQSRHQEVIVEWEKLYRQIFEIFDEYERPLVTIQLLRPLIERMFQLMEWNQFRMWAMLHGNIALGNGIKDKLDDKDKEGLTYYTQDYEDLMVFSIMLKPFMPIWGIFHNEYTEIIGKYSIHISAYDVIKSVTTINLPPIVKLENYIQHFVENKVDTIGFSLVSGIGTEEIPKFLLALSLIKKVIVYDAEDMSSSIIKNVYHLLTERCNEINRTKPKEKVDTEGNLNDTSASDMYKIIQRIPPSVSAMIEYYSQDIPKMIRDIDNSVPEVLINKYCNMKLEVDIQTYHIQLIGIICNRIISVRSLQLINYESLISFLKTASCVAEHWGYLEVSELLTTVPIKRDINQISSSITGNRSYNLLHPSLHADVTKLYQYQSNNKNPGLMLIDSIIKDVIKYDWNVTSNNFVNMRNSVAYLLIKQFGEMSSEQQR